MFVVHGRGVSMQEHAVLAIAAGSAAKLENTVASVLVVVVVVARVDVELVLLDVTEVETLVVRMLELEPPGLEVLGATVLVVDGLEDAVLGCVCEVVVEADELDLADEVLTVPVVIDDGLVVVLAETWDVVEEALAVVGDVVILVVVEAGIMDVVVVGLVVVVFGVVVVAGFVVVVDLTVVVALTVAVVVKVCFADNSIVVTIEHSIMYNVLEVAEAIIDVILSSDAGRIRPASFNTSLEG